MSAASPALPGLPFVGRRTDLTNLADGVARALDGKGSLLVVTGEGGVGKSRLVEELRREAERRSWVTAAGAAYPVELGVPYALFSDALVPWLRKMEPETLTVLARGTEAHLFRLFPALSSDGETPDPPPSVPGASETQLFWSLAGFLRSIGGREPLVVVLDDLHWADVSSLELLHFLSRQLSSDPVAFVAAVNDAERDGHPTLRATERSLVSLGVASIEVLEPLTPGDTDELVRETFGLDSSVTREFTALLYGWTRGNPFFIEEILKELVESGRLRRSGGSWLGWEIAELQLPRSVREAILLRIDRLSEPAREVAELTAVVGTRARYDLLATLVDRDDTELVEILEELTHRQVLSEQEDSGHPVYDFKHPLVRQTLTQRVGLARRRLMHGRVAEALERLYGARAVAHADELALHFVAGEVSSLRGVRYLAAAGRQALARYANREAAEYYAAALERLEAAGTGDDPSAAEAPDRVEVMQQLARARQRLGSFGDAIELWHTARDAARSRGDLATEAQAMRRIGLAHFFGGRPQAALEAWDPAVQSAAESGDTALEGRIRLARGMALQAVGRVDEARAELERALALADEAGHEGLSAGIHRALLLFHTWSGPASRAREHGRRALELAAASDDKALAGTCHWALAVLEGLTGQSEPCAYHIAETERLAEQLHSPLLRLAIAEVSVEYASGVGNWDSGVALGERMIALGKSLNQQALLPRLLVWTALIYLGRDDLERATALIDEAWDLSGAGHPGRGRNIHALVPAHIGRATRHLVLGEQEKAIEVVESALDVVDRTGYRMWATHRLLPVLAEAYLDLRRLDEARQIGRRLREEATILEDRLGLAWADACDALLIWLEGDPIGSIEPLQAAAEGLEAIPYVSEAARLRRQMAARLDEAGRRDEAISELRGVHDVFVRLGCNRELDKTREMLHQMGSRPPARTVGMGREGLTGRELEVVQLIVAGESNKAIAKALGITPRTVGTHLTNIYRKLEVSSRTELAEKARTFLGTTFG